MPSSQWKTVLLPFLDGLLNRKGAARKGPPNGPHEADQGGFHHREATVVVEGLVLTLGQVITLRVALGDLHERMSEPNALGSDDHGITMARNYRESAAQVLQILHGAVRSTPTQHGGAQ